MFIRSQDKLSLGNCERFAVVAKREWNSEKSACAPTGKYDIKGIFNGEYEHEDIDVLGTYTSKERALQVHGEIQEHIEEMRRESLLAALGEKGTYEVIAWGKLVFQMPES
jgi:sucrose-6-phosphate hydrolase SacC (GH32 family)